MAFRKAYKGAFRKAFVGQLGVNLNQPFIFAWLTDWHTGDTSWQAGEESAIVTELNTKNIDFVLSTGDQIYTTGDQTETDEYNAIMANLNVPIYNLRGNHDGSQFTEHFVIDHKGLRIIAFYASYVTLPEPPTYNNTANISASELAWIETQMQGIGSKNCILAGHYPISSTIGHNIDTDNGLTELLALCEAYNVKVYLSGHVHAASLARYYVDDVINANGPAAVGADSFMLVDVDNEGLTINAYDALTPYAEQIPEITTPYVGDDVEPIELLLTSDGDGTGVLPLNIEVDEETVLTLGDNAKFYTDTAGTLNESSTWTIQPNTSGVYRHIKCTTGTATLTIDKPSVTRFFIYTTNTNIPIISGDISPLVKNKYFYVGGTAVNNQISGDISGMTDLEYYRDSSLITGDASLLTKLQYLQIGDHTRITLPTAIALKNLSYLYIGNTSIMAVEQTNQLLADLWANRDEEKPIDNRTIDIRAKYGSSSPTGQGLIDKAALQAYRSPNNAPENDLWTVSTR